MAMFNDNQIINSNASNDSNSPVMNIAIEMIEREQCSRGAEGMKIVSEVFNNTNNSTEEESTNLSFTQKTHGTDNILEYTTNETLSLTSPGTRFEDNTKLDQTEANQICINGRTACVTNSFAAAAAVLSADCSATQLEYLHNGQESVYVPRQELTFCADGLSARSYIDAVNSNVIDTETYNATQELPRKTPTSMEQIPVTNTNAPIVQENTLQTIQQNGIQNGETMPIKSTHEMPANPQHCVYHYTPDMKVQTDQNEVSYQQQYNTQNNFVQQCQPTQYQQNQVYTNYPGAMHFDPNVSMPNQNQFIHLPQQQQNVGYVNQGNAIVPQFVNQLPNNGVVNTQQNFQHGYQMERSQGHSHWTMPNQQSNLHCGMQNTATSNNRNTTDIPPNVNSQQYQMLNARAHDGRINQTGMCELKQTATATTPSGQKIYFPLEDAYEIKRQNHDLFDIPENCDMYILESEGQFESSVRLIHSPRPVQLKGSLSDSDFEDSDSDIRSSSSESSKSVFSEKLESCEKTVDSDDDQMEETGSPPNAISPNMDLTEILNTILANSGDGAEESNIQSENSEPANTSQEVSISATEQPNETAIDHENYDVNISEVIAPTLPDVSDPPSVISNAPPPQLYQSPSGELFNVTVERANADDNSVDVPDSKINNADEADGASYMCNNTGEIGGASHMYNNAVEQSKPDNIILWTEFNGNDSNALQGTLPLNHEHVNNSEQIPVVSGNAHQSFIPPPQMYNSEYTMTNDVENSNQVPDYSLPAYAYNEYLATNGTPGLENNGVANYPNQDLIDPEDGLAYPALHVSDEGIVTVILRKGICLEMTTDRALRLVNHEKKLVVAINNTGNAACIIHPAAKIFQSETTVDIDLFLARKAKMTAGSIVFGNNFKTYRFDYKMIKELEGAANFRDLSQDYSVHFLDTDAGFYNYEMAMRCNDITSRAYFEKVQDNGCKVILNGVKVIQNNNGDVSVFCGPVKFLRMSPSQSVIRLKTHFLEVDVEANWNVKLSRGSHSMNASHLGFILSNGHIKACLDKTNNMHAFSLPEHRWLNLGQPIQQRRPGVGARRRFMSPSPGRFEPEPDHWSYTRRH